MGLLIQCIHIARQSQCHHISVQPIDDGAGLLTRAAMRLFDGDVLATGGFPMFGKGGVELDIQLPCGVVGNIQKRHRTLGKRSSKQGGKHKPCRLLQKLSSLIHGIPFNTCKSAMKEF
jgi:hypothetical protein